MKFWKVFGLVTFIVFIFVIGIGLGYVIGYQDGARDVVKYASEMIDRIKIDNVNVDINQTKIDNVVNELKNMTERLFSQRYNCTTGGQQC